MKRLVRESLNKLHSFERKKDPISSLHIGKRKLIEDWLDEMKITNCNINNDLTININTSIDLEGKHIHEFPDYIQFNKILGYFDCNCVGLINLRGCPFYVEGFFSCANNYLETLEHCPIKVTGDFDCQNNKVLFNEKYVLSLCDCTNLNVYKIIC